jgi:hypothetical protein
MVGISPPLRQSSHLPHANQTRLNLRSEFLHIVNDYVIGSDDPLFKMTCGVHYDLKLVDDKWVAMKKTYMAGIGDGRPLAAIRFTVFARLTRKASGPKPNIYIYIYSC